MVDYNKFKRLKANRDKVKEKQKLNKFLEQEPDIYTDKNLKVKYK